MKNAKFSTKKKIMASASMLVVSSIMLSTATYAWFTMNKEVSVTGMEVKAHSEEGLLINEVADASSTYWDELATGGTSTAIQLRPASTANLSTWWHANSKKSNSEAGGANGSVDTDTVEITDGVYYENISPANVSSSNTAAVAGTNADTTVYYKDATFGNTANTLDDGEGFYVKYTYFLKSSGSTALNIASGKLMVNVTAEKLNADGQTDSVNLDKSLRVGVKINSDYLIFAPVSGADASNPVAGSTAGTTYSTVTPVTSETAINSAALSIPSVTTDGQQVDVFIWFEGEDSNCKSDNLTAVLDEYQIDITFRDADL